MDGSGAVCNGNEETMSPEGLTTETLATPTKATNTMPSETLTPSVGPQTPLAETPSDSCPGYMEEDKPIISGVTVRAATPKKLIELVVESFSDKDVISANTEFPRVFFLMHKWFLSSNDLAEEFVELYQSSDDTVICDHNQCLHTTADKNCEINRYKTRIGHAVRYWIKTFPVHFDLDPKLREVVHRFRSVLKAEGSSQLEMVDLSKVPSYEWIRNMSVRTTPARQHNKVSLVFNHLEPDELAEQLTFLEHKAFRRITFSDFKHYAIHASLKDNPKLERSIALFNGLSQWIQCMVLSKKSPQQRADVIVKFIDVAKRLKALQNFNTFMAVVGGLTHSSLARLAKTNGCLPSERQKILMEFTELLSSNNNFSNYRKALAQSSGFRIPILGVHLKDLISLHIALPDKVEGNLINFRKMVQLSIILKELTKLQHESVPVEANMDLINTIKLSLDLHYSEDEIYELSLAVEPRSSLSSPSTPTKPVVFADWVAGVSPPDPDTINKHVHDMVEAVFKNYDHDKDGFISHEEFDAIAGNFPFIDSFYVLDADKDGMISKSEMKTYFNRANCLALRSSFKHAFHETTYFKPTFCIHCTGLLWGLIKQGWKCRECGINAHKHCKDLVVMECRGKMGSGRRSDILNGSMGHNDLTLSSKRKMSQRQRMRRIDQATQTNFRDFSSDSISIASRGSTHFTHDSKGSGRFSSYSRSSVSTDSGIGPLHDSDFYEEPAVLHERLLRAEEAREKLIAENATLRSQLDVATENIFTLKSHIGLIRQHTINFILHQMDTLHIQRDTEL